MANAHAMLIQELRRLCVRRDATVPDAELLQAFVQRRDEAAFEALVWRHGPMVMGVCHRSAGNAQDAEDAFQATFLVLTLKATSILRHDSLASWLHGVAFRTARKAKLVERRRQRREQAVSRAESHQCLPEVPERLPFLDEELNRLPQKYRRPIVLCDLEGKSRKEAAAELGWSEGTLSGQLARARKQLRQRLQRHGLSLGAGAVTVTLFGGRAEAIPAEQVVSSHLISSTVEAASQIVAGLPLATVVAMPVVTLTEGVIRSMYLSRMIQVMAALVIMIGLALGLWTGASDAAVPVPEAPKAEKKAEAVSEIRQVHELLKNRKVLRELKCSAEQRVKIEDAFEDLEDVFEERQKAIERNDPNPDKALETLEQEKDAEIVKLGRSLMANVLNAKQRQRLVQIDLQTRGPHAFMDEAVVMALRLSDADKQNIAQALVQMQNQLGAIDEPDDVAKLVRATAQHLFDGLNKEQQQAWKKLVGDSVTFEIPERLMPAEVEEPSLPDDV